MCIDELALALLYYRKKLLFKKMDSQKIVLIILKFEQCSFTRVICPKDAERMTNSIDPDQDAPLAAVWSGSTLFVLTCLANNLRSLGIVLTTSFSNQFSPNSDKLDDSSQGKHTWSVVSSFFTTGSPLLYCKIVSEWWKTMFFYANYVHVMASFFPCWFLTWHQ